MAALRGLPCIEGVDYEDSYVPDTLRDDYLACLSDGDYIRWMYGSPSLVV